MEACGRVEISILGEARPRVIEVVLDKNAGFPFITLNQSFSSVLIQDQYVDSWLFWNIDGAFMRFTRKRCGMQILYDQIL